MNLRHAAALTLVGWYLMTPPANLHNRSGKDVLLVDQYAPLSTWEIQGSFDSARECSKQLAFMVDWATRLTPASKTPTNIQNVENQKQKWASAACIATDDPRLKGP